ncbi:MAG TPA: acyl-CoA dehydrogenase family protein [Thermomicrobiales bacterium]
MGRVYEGLINALQLINLFGTAEQATRAATEARDERKLFAVWNTEGAKGIHLEPLGNGGVRLSGAKLYTSGAGWADRAIVPGALPDGGWQMCLVPLDQVTTTIDRSVWRTLGMRASASYRTDFTGVELSPEALIGSPGAYHCQPWFSGGPIRFAAVQLGGAAALVDAAPSVAWSHVGSGIVSASVEIITPVRRSRVWKRREASSINNRRAVPTFASCCGRTRSMTCSVGSWCCLAK